MSNEQPDTGDVREIYGIAMQYVDETGEVIVSYQEATAQFEAWLTQVKTDAAEATLARLRALLDQIEHTQYHRNIDIDRVRRALGDVTP